MKAGHEVLPTSPLGHQTELRLQISWALFRFPLWLTGFLKPFVFLFPKGEVGGTSCPAISGKAKHCHIPDKFWLNK